MADRDVVLQADTDEIPTAAALLEGANLLWNGVGEEGVAIPVVDLRMQTYSLSLSHMVTEPVRRVMAALCPNLRAWRVRLAAVPAPHAGPHAGPCLLASQPALLQERNRVLNNRAKMFQFAARHTCSLQSIRSDWLTDSCPQHKVGRSLAVFVWRCSAAGACRLAPATRRSCTAWRAPGSTRPSS